MEDSRPPALPALTGLRFVAAFVVVLFHSQFLIEGLSSSGLHAAHLIQSGYIGVSVFFVLSGFILAYTYVLPGGGLRGTRGSFWFARFARIYPVYLLALLFSLPLFLDISIRHPVGVMHLRDVIRAAVLTPTLLQAWTPKKAWMWDGPAWSLSVEAFFYLLFPYAAASISKQPLRRVLITGALLGVCVVTGPVLFALRTSSGVWKVTPSVYGPWVAAVKFLPLFHLPEFLIGVCAGVIFVNRRALDSNRRTFAWVTLASAAAIIAVLSVSNKIPYLLLHDGLLAPLVALLIYGLATGGGFIGRMLSIRSMQLLGGASYALYLFHSPLNSYLTIAARYFDLDNRDGWDVLAVYVAAAISIAIVVYVFVEEPARSRLKRLFRNRRPQKPSAIPMRSARQGDSSPARQHYLSVTD
jgi:peptidoglycan/LPS O-acetylase OafA/YrhL